MPRLIVICGPTASGKTSLAIHLAQALNTHIISCDSRQFYQELDIGVARPSADELAAAPHHFIANRSVTQPYNVSSYEQEALSTLEQLFATHDSVIAVGGSGLYIDALCNGVAFLPDPSDELRAELKEHYAKEGIGYFQSLLKRLDPDYYAVVDQNNPIRLQRALEVCITTGRPYSVILQEQQQPQPRPFDIVRIAIDADRSWLRERIDRRVEEMIANGLVEECRSLLPYRHLNTLNTVGYKELFAFIDQRCTLEEAVEQIKLNTWHYAKKQFTWLRRYNDLQWIQPNDETILQRLIG